MAGRARYSRLYRVFQPFQNTSKFILFQCFGWIAYSLHLTLVLLGLSHDASVSTVTATSYGEIGWSAWVGLISQICLIVSLEFFDDYFAAPRVVDATRISTLTRDPSSPTAPKARNFPFITLMQPGENCLSLAAALAGLAAFVSVDTLHLWKQQEV